MKLKPSVEVKLEGNARAGIWLSMEVEDVKGIDSELAIYTHMIGSFGSATIRGVDRDFVRSLASQLSAIIGEWEREEEGLTNR